MSKKEFVYTGQNNLEAVQEAVNYNNFQRNFVLEQVQKINKKTVKVLDFGAGIGTYADMIKDEGITVDCLEPDAKQAKILKQKGYKNYTSINQVKQKYDVIYALNVFEHIENDSEVLAELKSLLAKNGRIIIYVPAFNALWTKMDDLVEHCRRYTIGMAKSLSQEAGLHPERVTYHDPIGFFAALTYKIMRGDGSLNPRTVKFYDKFLYPVSRRVEPVTGKVFGKNVLAILSHK